MKEVPIDSFASLYIDAIKYREKAARLQLELGQSELEASKFMREKLFQYVASKSGSSPDEKITIDLDSKKAFVVEESPAPKVEGETKVKQK